MAFDHTQDIDNWQVASLVEVTDLPDLLPGEILFAQMQLEAGASQATVRSRLKGWASENRCIAEDLNFN